MSQVQPSAVHLDSGFLVRALIAFSVEALALRTWLRQGRPVAMSAVAWGEFLCGTLAEEEKALAMRIVPTHVPVRREEADEAARLFNATGRRRGSFQDCVVAATALGAGAELATVDVAVFAPFEAHGVTLAK